MTQLKKTARLALPAMVGGLAVAAMLAPTAGADADCSPSGIANTVGTTTGQTRDYLAAHPGAEHVFNAAKNQPRPQAEATIRGYFTANPQEYQELRGILEPIGDTQRDCNVTVLPPDLATAYDTFMAG
jgi:heme-binding protein